ncbi:hypothetical protein FKG94_21455 [Exilibacterium tricleocarpae]|uniref:Phosphotyrosine protein phosphatase I domain-containing protein n=1 Tax=Exilibacterium tricleocarpae TaxID=2591008 RepID=A0A545T083_9GAMM|nr:hypothetical protein FKG94_21455 [Exilibacterium tricleocarpae]
MKNVLVLCTSNSCRSIMAAALINALGAGRYIARSAGSKAAGFVHPKSIATLKRYGINVDEPRSKSWDEFEGEQVHAVTGRMNYSSIKRSCSSASTACSISSTPFFTPVYSTAFSLFCALKASTST